MKVFSFYHRETGQFTGSTFMTSNEDEEKIAEDVAAHLPSPDHAALEGTHDAFCTRVDVETGELVEWRPPPPSTDHEWCDSTKRWKLCQAALEKQSHRAHAHGRIAQLADTERHLIRKLMLAATTGPQPAPIAQARAELQAIDDEIAELHKHG